VKEQRGTQRKKEMSYALFVKKGKGRYTQFATKTTHPGGKKGVAVPAKRKTQVQSNQKRNITGGEGSKKKPKHPLSLKRKEVEKEASISNKKKKKEEKRKYYQKTKLSWKKEG